MATLTVASAARTGVDIAGVAAGAAGDEWANTGQEVALVTNGSGSPITVTLDIKPTLDGAAVTDPTVAINAGITKAIGPFPPGIYNSATGLAKITYSLETSVTVKILKVTPA